MLSTETRIVLGVHPGAPRQVSRTKISRRPFVSPATKLVASDSKATKRPSGLIDGAPLSLLASPPAVSTETRTVLGVHPAAPAQVSRTKTSKTALVSPATRLMASDSKATKRPSALIEGLPLPVTPMASAPVLLTETRIVLGAQPVAPMHVSCTKISLMPLVSTATRLVA